MPRGRAAAAAAAVDTRAVGIGDAGVQAGNGHDMPEAMDAFLGSEYAVEVEFVGKAPLLCHAWNSAEVEEKGAAAKGSARKKSDNVESYVYRLEDGQLAMPAANIWACLSDAARSMQDPRSPRKSLRDMVRAGIRIEPLMIPFTPKKKTWDYIDRRRVVVQRSAITRSRPALSEGWKLRFEIQVLAGEYLSPQIVHDLLSRAGRFQGLGDFRPLFGLFRVDSFKKVEFKA